MHVTAAGPVHIRERAGRHWFQVRWAPARFLTASTLSGAGDWLTTLAVGVVLFRITGSGTAPAAFIVVRSAPRLAGPALGGWLADRWSPSRVAAVLAVVQGSFTAALIPAITHGAVWAVFLCVAGAQLVGAAARPMTNAILPHLAPPDDQRGLAALVFTAMGTCMLAAPALGVLLLRAHGADFLVTLDVLSFAIAAGLYMSLSTPAASGPPIRATPAAALRGISPMLRDPILRLLSAAYVGGAILVAGVQAAIVAIAADRFGNADVSGALYSAVGLGGVAGSIVAFRTREIAAGRALIVGFYLGEAIPLALITVVSGLGPVLVLLAISSASSVGYTTAALTEVGARLEPQLRGRGAAVLYFALFGGQLLGAGGTALLISVAGWRAAVVACLFAGGTAVLAGLLIGPQHTRGGWRRRRTLRNRLRRRPLRVVY